MIEEQARVLENGDGFAWVETRRQSACGACSANKACGSAALARVLGNRRSRVRALSEQSLSPGDWVLIGIEEGALLRGSLAVYLLPLMALLLGAVLGHGLGGEGMAVAGGLLGLVLGFVWLQGFSQGIRRDPRFQPRVLKRLDPLSGAAGPYPVGPKGL